MHGIVPDVWHGLRNCAGAKHGTKNVPEVLGGAGNCARDCAGIVHGIVPDDI